jgi:hypothetical protein
VSHRLRVLEELDAELVRVVEGSPCEHGPSRWQRSRRSQGPSRGHGLRQAGGLWWLRRDTRVRLLAMAGTIGLLLAGVAFAAGRLIDTGTPVGPVVGEAVFPNTARSGDGLPVPASIKILNLASADPSGGLAWGMRVFNTTRGIGCVQVGRLLGGQLGVLGQDGAFADDGRFHALPAQPSVGYEDCTALDRYGQTYLADSLVGIAASGFELGCTPPWNKPAPGEPAQCPAGDERELDFGLLGPQALSVTYEADGRSHTIPTVGPQGAYLIVTAPQAAQLTPRGRPRPLAPGTFTFNPEHGLPRVSINIEQALMRAALPQPSGVWRLLQGDPQQPIRKIVYRGGLTCTITSSGSDIDNAGKPCRPIGYVPAVELLPPSAAVATPVHVVIRHVRVEEPGHIVWFKQELTITFTARAAVDNVHASYGDTLQLPMTAPCRGGVLLGGIFRDVRVGEAVRIEQSGLGDDARNLLRCPGTYRGTVYYDVPTRFPVNRESEAVVGTFSFRVR